ncbi:helix-turn-helix domain-containing protein [Flavobacterium sp. KACC 22761]|uniref:winged helix-turn-helix transcriptional regulator n=1 Tax=Flavobacterium sp. KACC 22761 TaxID=3092665 RepID=UPI002A74FD6B|nr:helix-turn-helix domain-containing protein [Flavobacterium sp. KACC 22761]WPO77780.1 helix-turn-helix domain-containing protein [Flavobacterium sp. KACC 22761]
MARNQKEEFQALQDTLYVLGGKWKLPIINSICNGNNRFKDIKESIPGITSRMLSKELKDMELNNLVKRTEDPDALIPILYESTPYCKSFGPIISEMIKWGISHRNHIKNRETASER